MQASIDNETWPELPYAAWQDTCMTLQLWTQIVGKVRLTQTPWLNHSWQVALYVTPRGLSTSSIPHVNGAFELSFDFVQHVLRAETSDGGSGSLRLEAKSVADFYRELMQLLADLSVPVAIDEIPNEIPEPIRFSEDRTHASYDPEYAQRFARVLLQVDRVFKRFRSGFLGKSSPVHFFWGSFDLAVTRFSGRRAPLHPGGVPHLPDSVAQEAYSHEVSSAGFWPGGNGTDASFYSYAYPEPKSYRSAVVRPAQASFDSKLGEFVLPYASMRQLADPEAALLDFLHSTYEAAAAGADWARSELECALGKPGLVRRVG
jgi:hypothetical protein